LPYEIDHKYLFSQIGYNLKPLDLQGGIGLAQLKKAESIHQQRKENKIKIQKILSSVEGLRFPTQDDRADVSWFGVPVICRNFDQKTKIVNYLESNSIQTRNYFAGNILLHPAYKHLENWKNYPNASKVLGNVFFIGCSPTISEANLVYLEKIIKNYEN
jgi:CDP-6-deoxy-D-xylo-4-hexulose-3-dehydrase